MQLHSDGLLRCAAGELPRYAEKNICESSIK